MHAYNGVHTKINIVGGGGKTLNPYSKVYNDTLMGAQFKYVHLEIKFIDKINNIKATYFPDILCINDFKEYTHQSLMDKSKIIMYYNHRGSRGIR